MTPTQADRNAGAEFWAFLGQHGSAQACRDGTGFRDTAEAFARHRHAATAPLLDLIEVARGALKKADAALEVLNPTCISQFKLKTGARHVAEQTLAALTAALAQHRTNGDG